MIAPDFGRGWPTPPDEAAFYGLAGDVVRAIEPHSEADPVAVLVNTLVLFGAAVGTGPYVLVGPTKQPARTYAYLVGASGSGRKGESWSAPALLFRGACSGLRVVSGMSTGEGLVHAVRDPSDNDSGVVDKRLMVLEPEGGRPLRVMRRVGNTLPDVLRDAWDRGDLHVMTKGSPAVATGAYISVAAHITPEELTAELDSVSMADGFANRFIFLLVRRSKELPDPEPFEGPKVKQLILRLAEAIDFAQRIEQVRRDVVAAALWRDVYHDLTANRPGLTGAVCKRAEVQTLRLSLIYALLDRSPVIRKPHLEAALALWEYAEESVHRIFGSATGDPIADAILRNLKAVYPDSLPKRQIFGVFGNHVRAERIDQALGELLSHGRAKPGQQPSSGGRRPDAWTWIPEQRTLFAIRTSKRPSRDREEALENCEKSEQSPLLSESEETIGPANKEQSPDDDALRALLQQGPPHDLDEDAG